METLIAIVLMMVLACLLWISVALTVIAARTNDEVVGKLQWIFDSIIAHRDCMTALFDRWEKQRKESTDGFLAILRKCEPPAKPTQSVKKPRKRSPKK